MTSRRVRRFGGGAIILTLALAGCGAEMADSSGSPGSGSAPDNGGHGLPGPDPGNPATKTPGGNTAPPPGMQPDPSGGYMSMPGANTNIALGGAQDFGYFRKLLDAGQIPATTDFDAAGFFAEHHMALPPPSCGNRICLQALLGVSDNLSADGGLTMLQLGLNSTLVADPNQRPPLNLTVSIDVSGSMNVGGKIDYVRAGLAKLIDGLEDGDRIALITYSTTANVVFPMADVKLHRVELHDLVAGLQAAGSTAFFDGLKLGYDQAFAHFESGRQNRVILLSDGQPTVGETDLDRILAMSKAYNAEGLGLTTIGLGTDFNPALMQRLAQQADGNAYFLESSAAVTEVFTEELSYFTVPVAFDLKIQLEAGAEYVFGRAYGSPFWQNSGTTGGELDVPSIFLAHRKSHADQTPDGGRRGGGSAVLVELQPRRTADDGSGLANADVARINVSFREPGSDRRVTDSVVVNYPQAPWRTPQQGYFAGADAATVQKSYVMLNIYRTIEAVCRDFHLANARPMLGSLRRLRAAVVDYNEEVGDKDIESDVALIDKLSSVLQAKGVREEGNTHIPADPWPCDAH